MKRTFFCLLSLLVLFSCKDAPDSNLNIDDPNQNINLSDTRFITQTEALDIAQGFLKSKVQELPLRSGAVSLSFLMSDLETTQLRSSEVGLPSYYIFTLPEKGFVIVSATEAAYPILGFSLSSTIDKENLSPELMYLLGEYKNQIHLIREREIEPSDWVKRLRSRNLRGEMPDDVMVEPLTNDIKWDQMPHYNALCPPNAPVGCVATAASIIMRYWEYPSESKGHYGYNSRVFGWLENDYNHPLRWDQMPKELLEKDNQEIARLCYGVAVSVNMNFDYAYNGGSGAYPDDVPPALHRYYSYPKDVFIRYRNNFDGDTWRGMIMAELDKKHPIQYGGSGTNGGHSFVCDGYSKGGFFHINWGWGGQSNGWFKLEALNPSDLGTGGGAGGFNGNQTAIFNFAPPAVVKGDNNDKVPEEDNGGAAEIVYKKGRSLSTLDAFIGFTKFNNITTISSVTPDGYEDHSKIVIPVDASRNLGFEIVPSFTGDPMKVHYSIWIDLNNDGKFEEDEKVLQKVLNEAWKDSFKIPESISVGKHRMRVVLNAASVTMNPGIILSGEIEDYSLMVK